MTRFEEQSNYAGFMEWKSRNCDACKADGCNLCHRQYALAQTWQKDFIGEPDCKWKDEMNITVNLKSVPWVILGGIIAAIIMHLAGLKPLLG
jgi:hypothetical protein